MAFAIGNAHLTLRKEFDNLDHTASSEVTSISTLDEIIQCGVEMEICRSFDAIILLEYWQRLGIANGLAAMRPG